MNEGGCYGGAVPLCLGCVPTKLVSWCYSQSFSAIITLSALPFFFLNEYYQLRNIMKLFNLVIWFVLGALIGFIIGKIKSKK